MLGIIGGSGLYKIEALRVIEEVRPDTPFGLASAPITIGELNGSKVAFLPRHGHHHEHLPSEINFSANLWSLKKVGVRQIISVSATGSLKKELAPGEFAVVHQYFDWTKGKRVATFFGNGLSAHISTAKPTCDYLGSLLTQTAKTCAITLHTSATYACVEGPRLGTRAESFFLKNAGCDLVGMTNVPEAFLAREAQMCYTTLAIVTDYDCWHEDPAQHVSVEQVFAQYRLSLDKVKLIIAGVAQSIEAKPHCTCRTALKGAILTDQDRMSSSQKLMTEFLLN